MAPTWHAHEIDGGPSGVWWELTDPRGTFASSHRTLAGAVIAAGGPVAIYTLEDWFAAHDEEGNAPDYVEPARII